MNQLRDVDAHLTAEERCAFRRALERMTDYQRRRALSLPAARAAEVLRAELWRNRSGLHDLNDPDIAVGDELTRPTSEGDLR